MFKSVNFLLAMLLLLTGCSLASININGSFRGLTSYYKKTMALCGDQICRMVEDGKTENCKQIVLNGLEMKNIIKDHAKALVYIWSPSCKSSSCPSIGSLQAKCLAEGISLFVVSEYYDCDHLTTDLSPLYGIDIQYYKSNLTAKYINRFLSDLTGVKGLGKDEKRLFYFKKGKYITTVAYSNSIGF